MSLYSTLPLFNFRVMELERDRKLHDVRQKAIETGPDNRFGAVCAGLDTHTTTSHEQQEVCDRQWETAVSRQRIVPQENSSTHMKERDWRYEIPEDEDECSSEQSYFDALERYIYGDDEDDELEALISNDGDSLTCSASNHIHRDWPGTENIPPLCVIIAYREPDWVIHVTKPNAPMSGYGTVFHWACAYGDLSLIKHMINGGALINGPNHCLELPICYVIRCGHTDIVRLLLSNGAMVQQKYGPYMYDPMAIAAWLGRADAMELLIEQAHFQQDRAWDSQQYDLQCRSCLTTGFDMDLSIDRRHSSLCIAIWQYSVYEQWESKGKEVPSAWPLGYERVVIILVEEGAAITDHDIEWLEEGCGDSTPLSSTLWANIGYEDAKDFFANHYDDGKHPSPIPFPTLPRVFGT